MSRFIVRAIEWDHNSNALEKAKEIEDMLNSLAEQGYGLVEVKTIIFMVEERGRPTQTVLVIMEQEKPKRPGPKKGKKE